MANKGTIGEIAVKSEQEVEWKISDIFSFTGETDYYWSPIFTLSNYQWHFIIYPNGKEGSEGWISLFLHASNLSSDRGVVYTSGVKKCDGKIEKIRSNAISILKKSYGLGYDKYLKRSELAERKSELAPSDTFTITCTLRCYDDFDSTAKTSSLSNNLLEMFTSGKACDATLKVKQEKFSVHKCILMARSPVFAAMFETPMKEKATGVVDIEDCDPEAFRDFLVYLYSGRLEKLSRHMFELYKIADKYNVQDLKSDCVMAMMGNLSVENVTDVVSLAERSNEILLETTAGEFFNKNYVEILISSKWEMFMKDEQNLAHKLLKNMAEHLKK